MGHASYPTPMKQPPIHTRLAKKLLFLDGRVSTIHTFYEYFFHYMKTKKYYFLMKIITQNHLFLLKLFSAHHDISTDHPQCYSLVVYLTRLYNKEKLHQNSKASKCNAFTLAFAFASLTGGHIGRWVVLCAFSCSFSFAVFTSKVRIGVLVLM